MNQNDSQRREALKKALRDLHAGKSVEQVKAEYGQLFKGVDTVEISRLEQALLDEGVPEDELAGMCDLHMDTLETGQAQPNQPNLSPEPAINTYLVENASAGKVLDQLGDAIQAYNWKEAGQFLQVLRKFENHYARKEHVLFPYLEKHGFTGPSTVMWSIHDQIRKSWKALAVALSENPEPARVNEVFQLLNKAMRDMFVKEERILFPTALQMLTAEEWEAVRKQEKEPDLAFSEPAAVAANAYANPERESEDHQVLPVVPKPEDAGLPLISLQTGYLTSQQIDLLLTHLPVDVTYVDENDEVRYFSNTEERIFRRAPAIIGRRVQNCHPAASVHRVQKILGDFRAGKRDAAEFWIQMGSEGEKRFIYIRYFAVRDEKGQYRGTLEVSQDITEIRTLQGERRLEQEKE